MATTAKQIKVAAPKAPELAVRAVKTFRGMEGAGFNADLYVNGTKAALVIDEGNGGQYLFRWCNVRAEKTLTEYAKATLRPENRSVKQLRKLGVFFANGSAGLQTRLEEIVAKLVDDWEYQKKLRRICRTTTLFLAPGDDATKGYRTIKAPYDGRVREYIIKKYGNKVRIINEELSA